MSQHAKKNKEEELYLSKIVECVRTFDNSRFKLTIFDIESGGFRPFPHRQESFVGSPSDTLIVREVCDFGGLPDAVVENQRQTNRLFIRVICRFLASERR